VNVREDVAVSPTVDAYADLLSEGQELYGDVSIGRPGRASSYAWTVRALSVLRARLSIDLTGVDNVAAGPAILVGNHTSTFDPIVVVMQTGWRVTAFTKAEWFSHRIAPFFRLMGQIPLRRGDEPATDWAMRMAQSTLNDGNKVGLYPEGTRAPDQGKLYRLHSRILVPLLQANPTVPVHAVATRYEPMALGRTKVTVKISPRLAIDSVIMTADEMVTSVKDALVELGDLIYVNQYAFVAKARLERERQAKLES
jgi:1-acyl-sn-glycerol-3-phosphate acyltransferase